MRGRAGSAAVAETLIGPGRIDRDDTGAVAGCDQRMKIGDTAALRGLRAAFCPLLRDFGFADSAAENAGGRLSRFRDLALERGLAHRAEHPRLLSEVLVDALRLQSGFFDNPLSTVLAAAALGEPDRFLLRLPQHVELACGAHANLDGVGFEIAVLGLPRVD